VILIIIHVTKPGESLNDLSSLYNVPVEKICIDNNIDNRKLLTNQAVIIDASDNIHPWEKLPIEVVGYVYPTVKTDILEKSLPDLTYLCIFSYAINMDGNPDMIEDEVIIDLALQYQTAPLMVITNKYFSSYIARELLNNKDVQNRLIDNIIYILKTKNYYGINVDFEYIFPNDRIAYNDFLKRLTSLLDPMGLKVFSSLAPKVINKNKMLCEAHDYKSHGKLSHRVCLMTYEWGYTYSTPMAVSPVNKVMQVLDYAAALIPAEKTMIGIPNYGYEWRLPWMEGTAATAVTNNTAMEKAVESDAEIRFDSGAQTPYFYHYDKHDKLHVTWFEDARSILAKLDTVNRYKIAGVCYWTTNNPYCQIRFLLRSMYNILKLVE